LANIATSYFLNAALQCIFSFERFDATTTAATEISPMLVELKTLASQLRNDPSRPMDAKALYATLPSSLQEGHQGALKLFEILVMLVELQTLASQLRNGPSQPLNAKALYATFPSSLQEGHQNVLELFEIIVDQTGERLQSACTGSTLTTRPYGTCRAPSTQSSLLNVSNP
jgi:hypothetical protein